MNWLYYTNYLWFTRVVSTSIPEYSSVVMMSLTQVGPIYILMKILYLYNDFEDKSTPMEYFIPFQVLVIIMNYLYYKKRGNEIIKRISLKSKKKKIFIVAVSVFIMLMNTALIIYIAVLVRISNGFEIW
jgi:hypothetical protein